MRMIPRDNLQISESTVVCEKHFAPDFIIRIDTATRPDGSVLTVPRKNPKLAADAYPTNFPNLPSYLSQPPPVNRKTTDDRREQLFCLFAMSSC
jgi:hypothetical protein